MHSRTHSQNALTQVDTHTQVDMHASSSGPLHTLLPLVLLILPLCPPPQWEFLFPLSLCHFCISSSSHLSLVKPMLDICLYLFPVSKHTHTGIGLTRDRWLDEEQVLRITNCSFSRHSQSSVQSFHIHIMMVWYLGQRSPAQNSLQEFWDPSSYGDHQCKNL